MINWFKNKKEEVKKGISKSLAKELYIQSLKNVKVISATINTMSASINSIKTRGSEENKERKEFLQNQVGWYEKKLEEERGNVEHYKSLWIGL